MFLLNYMYLRAYVTSLFALKYNQQIHVKKAKHQVILRANSTHTNCNIKLSSNFISGHIK